MAGVKGRSGRKSWDKERDMHRLWDLSIPVLVHALTSPDVPEADKRALALELVKKMVPVPAPLEEKRDTNYHFTSVLNEIRKVREEEAKSLKKNLNHPRSLSAPGRFEQEQKPESDRQPSEG